MCFMVQITDVISETLSSPVTSEEISPVMRMGGSAERCAVTSCPAPAPGNADLDSFTLRGPSRRSAQEPKRSLSKPHD